MGALFVVLGLISSSFVTQIWHLYLTYGVLTGVGFSLSFSPGMIAVAQYFTTKRSRANGYEAVLCPPVQVFVTISSLAGLRLRAPVSARS